MIDMIDITTIREALRDDELSLLLSHIATVGYGVDHAELSPAGWQTVSRRLAALALAVDQRAAESLKIVPAAGAT
jgi:hypothetical protein